MSEGPGSNLHETIGANRESPASGLRELAASLDIPLDPNDEFDLAYTTFQMNYFDFSAEEMPDGDYSKGPYSEYIGVEDLFAACNPPTRLNQVKINTLRETMQRYAMSHRDE